MECIFLPYKVAEFFEDYDPLRSGSISKAQFRRGLGLLGLSKLGSHDLQEGQFQVLIDAYTNPAKEDQALWTQFLWDVETGIIIHYNDNYKINCYDKSNDNNEK